MFLNLLNANYIPIVAYATNQEHVNFSYRVEVNQDSLESEFFFSKIFQESGNSPKWGIPIDLGLTIQTDNHDNIILGGGTTQNTFPVKNGHNHTFGGVQDGFVTKMDENGEIIWSTFIGGSKQDVVTSIAIGGDDSVFVNGYTESSNFPLTSGVFQENHGGLRDIFLIKFNSHGVLNWSTFIGGEENEGSYSNSDGGKSSIVVDSQDNVILSGTTSSENFPLQAPYQPFFNGGSSDAFLSMFNGSGEIIWSTYLGGSLTDTSSDVIVDSQDNIIIIGQTESDDFPVLNAFDATLSTAKNSDGFVAKFNTSGNLLWSTHQGGDAVSQDNLGFPPLSSNAVEVDSKDQIIIGSTTTLLDNPTPNGQQKDIGGFQSGYISKYSEDGTLIYGSYYGGENGRNQVIDIYVDAEDSLLVAIGSAESVIDLENSYYSFSREISEYYLADPRINDPRLIKFDINNELQWSTDYVSSIKSEGTMEVTIDNTGRILATGYVICDELCESVNLPGSEGEKSLLGASPFLQIIKLDPIDDGDSDGLLNYEEFHSGSSPRILDTDGDGLNDGVEVHTHLTDPTNEDSDLDGLDDKYEIDQGYSATNNDTDADEMLDYFEDYYKLDATFPGDTKLDPDKDNLDNLGEFKAGTHPKIGDTDGDGMKDGYEVENGLDPLKDDAGKDKDGDFLPNKFEHDNRNIGLNPNSPIDVIFVGLVLILSISAGIFYIIRLKRLNKQAKNNGYADRKEMKETEKRGFTSLDERNLVESQGFKTKDGQMLVQEAKHETVVSMIEYWKSQIKLLDQSNQSTNLKEIQEIVTSTTSPINLREVELGYKHTLDELNQFQLDSSSVIALQQSISNLPLVDDELPFIGFSIDELVGLRDQVTNVLINLNLTIDNLMKIFETRKQWFEPWQRLLTLIQMTQDGLPIELIKIAEVIQGTEDQAENLLELLLEENTLIGKYDSSKRIYTKGANISQYIRSMLETFSSFDE